MRSRKETGNDPIEVTCDPGETMVGGGASTLGDKDRFLVETAPISNGWRAQSQGANESDVTVVYVLCVS